MLQVVSAGHKHIKVEHVISFGTNNDWFKRGYIETHVIKIAETRLNDQAAVMLP